MGFTADILNNTSQSATNIASGQMVTADGQVGYVVDYVFSGQNDFGDTGTGFFSYISGSIVSQGAGYNIADILTQVGGTEFDSAPPYQEFVTGLDGSGGVQNAETWSQNSYYLGVPHYTTPPTNPISFDGAGGGTGLTIHQDWVQIYTNGPWIPSGLPSIVSPGTGYNVPPPDLTITSAAGTRFTDGYFSGVNTYPAYSLIVSSTGGSGAVTGVTQAGWLSFAGGNASPNYIAIPPNPDSWSGGSGSGQSLLSVYARSGQAVTRLAQWDLTTGIKTFETSAGAPFDAWDWQFGPMAVRLSDNHLFAVNGYNKLYNIAPGLTVAGSYTRTSSFPYMIAGNPFMARSATYPNNFSARLDTTRAAPAIAVGTNRAYIFQTIDFSGLFGGIDVFDISSANPAPLRSALWPDFPVFPSPGPVPGMVVDPNDDSAYFTMFGPATTQFRIGKLTSSGTTVADTAAINPSDYVFQNTSSIAGGQDNCCVFALDPVNRILIFGGIVARITSPTRYSQYKITAFSLPSMTVLWTNPDFRLTLRTDTVNGHVGPQYNTVGGNIVNGKWVTVVYSGFSASSSSTGPTSAILTSFNTTDGSVSQTVDTATITNYSAVIPNATAGYSNCNNAVVSQGW